MRKKEETSPITSDETVGDSARTEESVVTTDQNEVTKVDDKKRVNKKTGFQVVKQGDNASLEIGKKGSSSTFSGSTPGISTFNVGSYSGDGVRSLVGDASSLQRQGGNHNPDGRFRKKVDLPVREINDKVSEQTSVEFKTLPGLQEDRESTEGYRGRLSTKVPVVQKTSGSQVAELNMFRSLDEIKRDEIYFSSGQNIFLEGSQYVQAPPTHRDSEGTEHDISKDILGKTRPTGLKRGNYVPKNLKVKLTKSATGILVKDFQFEVDDNSIEVHDDELANISAVHARTHGNYAETVRRMMEDKAGNEAELGWSPLPRAIHHPTSVIGLLKDVEEDLGNVVFFAHRKLSESLAYQVNRAGKDGLHIMRPITEAVLKPILGETDSDAQFLSEDIFSRENMLKGSAGLLISAFDTVKKYDSKGVFLNLKRKSFAGALNVAEKNAAGFRASKFFVDTVNQQQSFSTIHKDYDPASPVYISDNVRISHPYNFADFIDIKDATKNFHPHERNFGVGYTYRAPNSPYSTMVNHPLVTGIYDYIVNYRNQLYRELKGDNSNGTVELNIPIVYSTTAITLWEMLVLNATPFMRRERLSSMRELLDYENVHGYPFEDKTVDVKTLWGTSPDNYRFSSIDEPLTTHRMNDQLALTWMLPELHSYFDEEGSYKFKFLNPFYINEKNYSMNSERWDFDPMKASYSFPIIRSGVTTESLMKAVETKPRDFRLAYDIATRPLILSGDDTDIAIYKYDVTTDGLIVNVEDTKTKMGELVELPRQIGSHFVAPYGYNTPVPSITGTGENRYVDKNEEFVGRNSYRAIAFFNSDSIPTKNVNPELLDSALNPINPSKSMGSNLRQSWVANHAGDVNSSRILNGMQLGLMAGIDTDKTLIDGVSKVRPFADVNGQMISSNDDGWNVVNYSNPIHFRLNLAPFIISPWDTVPKPSSLGEDGYGVDPLMFAYMFNLVGFYASDYTEEVDIRMQDMVDKSDDFVEDKWVSDKFNKSLS